MKLAQALINEYHRLYREDPDALAQTRFFANMAIGLLNAVDSGRPVNEQTVRELAALAYKAEQKLKEQYGD